VKDVKKAIPLVIVFLFSVSMLQAQDNSLQNDPPIDKIAEKIVESEIIIETGKAAISYIIRSISFNINGKTRPFALIYHGEFKEGDRITGKTNLEGYIIEKKQLLINQRVLEEVEIEYSFGEPEGDGSLPVNLLIHVRDTWNFIILPYPQYDSNEGLTLTLKIRDYNFLGTMSPLRIDLGYQNDIENRNSFNLLLESSTPFRAVGLIWNFRFDHDFVYTINEPLYYKNITGISVELPAENVITTLGFNQYLIINESNSEHDKDKYELDSSRFYGPYAASEIFSSFKIPLMAVGNYGSLSYTPRIAGKISYTKGGVDEPRRPLGILSHTLGFGRINWTGNFRQGLLASLENSNYFYMLPDWNSEDGWYSEIEGNAAIYHNFNKYLGISSHLKYRQRFNDTYYNAGDELRGIVNNRVRSEQMLSLNADFTFRVLRFFPSELFTNPKLHFFDFELHGSTFFDFALAEGKYKQSGSKEDPYEESRFKLDNAFYCAGMEVIVFPAFMRSLYLRLSVGYDIRRFTDTRSLLKWDEIFIGIGHHY
jgi:outer membrane protein assembly factor BamA